MISWARYPWMRSAAAFQLAPRPSGSSMKMAQSWMLSTRSWNVCSLRCSASCVSLRAVKSRVTLANPRSEEHTSELQSQSNLVCRLLLEKKNNFMVRSYYTSECHADHFDFERIEALKPAI